MKQLQNVVDWFGTLATQLLVVRTGESAYTGGGRLHQVHAAISSPNGGSAEWRLHMGYIRSLLWGNEMKASQLFENGEGFGRQMWILVDFRHHGAQYGMHRVP